MKKHWLPLLALVLLGVGIPIHAAGQEITGFGTDGPNIFSIGNAYFINPWVSSEASVTSMALTITGAPDSAGGFYEPLATPVDITGDTAFLTLTGTLDSPAPPAGLSVGSAQLVLYDSAGNTDTYDINFNAFLYGPHTVSFALTSSASDTMPSTAFNGTVEAYELDTGGSPADAQDLTFDFNELQASSSAVPEPCTDALLAAGALFVLGLAGRKYILRAV
jgi:hypothetical protein